MREVAPTGARALNILQRRAFLMSVESRPPDVRGAVAEEHGVRGQEDIDVGHKRAQSLVP